MDRGGAGVDRGGAGWPGWAWFSHLRFAAVDCCDFSLVTIFHYHGFIVHIRFIVTASLLTFVLLSLFYCLHMFTVRVLLNNLFTVEVFFIIYICLVLFQCLYLLY